MPLKLVRNDIVKMQVDAIVNTANAAPIYSSGIDTAVYKAAGEAELLAERQKIGFMEEGEAAITPGFKLPAKYIIHAVSPRYIDGKSGEEEKLRSCYRRSLELALENRCKSVALPLIATGSFGYPKEEGMGIAVDEINKFLLKHDMTIYLVVFDTKATELALRLQPALDAYIDSHYVSKKREEEYGDRYFGSVRPNAPNFDAYRQHRFEIEERTIRHKSEMAFPIQSAKAEQKLDFDDDYLGIDEDALDERVKHVTDTFSEYLLYLIKIKGLKHVDVYTDALVTKQTFHKIKKNPHYAPKKDTVLRLCIGAKLSLDESKDLLARAGYAFSPCDVQDIIFKFYIENEAYSMVSIAISLEDHGLPCYIE